MAESEFGKRITAVIDAAEKLVLDINKDVLKLQQVVEELKPKDQEEEN